MHVRMSVCACRVALEPLNATASAERAHAEKGARL